MYYFVIGLLEIFVKLRRSWQSYVIDVKCTRNNTISHHSHIYVHFGRVRYFYETLSVGCGTGRDGRPHYRGATLIKGRRKQMDI